MKYKSINHFLSALLFILSSFIGYAQPDSFKGNKAINGTNLFVNIRGQGEYLLVLHGGPGLNHAYFLPYLNALEKNFKVVYYDQRACGKSSIPSPDSISMKFFVEDMEAIRKNLKVDKLNVLAHSWGAVLAAHYTLAYPNRIQKLILSNPSMFSREYDEEASKLIKKNSTREDSLAQAQLMAGGNLNSEKYEKLFLLSFKPSAFNKANVSKINLDLPANFGEANNILFGALMKDPSLNANLYDSLKAFQFPVLIIHGKADVIPMSAIERLKTTLPQANLEIFQQSGHFPFVEETDRFNTVVLKFLLHKK